MQKLLNKLEEYSKQIQADYKSGTPWRYSTRGPADNKLFDVEKVTNKVINCGSLTRWVLRDLGIMTTADHLYPNRSNIFKQKGNVDTKATILKSCDILYVNRTGSAMIADGTLKPGDMCFAKDHANIYAGNGMWYESGRTQTNGYYQNGQYYFKTVGPVKGSGNETIYCIIRLK